MKELFCIALATFLLVGCSNQDSGRTDNGDADIVAIEDSLRKIVQASEAGDTDGYIAYTTEDFVWHGSGDSPVEGRGNVRQFLSRFFDDSNISFPWLETDEVVVAGDAAIHRYSGLAEITPKGGGDPVTLSRRYLDVMRKGSDGVWRLALHTFDVVEPGPDNAANFFKATDETDQAKIDRIIRYYVQTRHGQWTLSRTVTDAETGEISTTRAFDNPQTAEGPWSWHVLNTEDAWRSYRKYRETYANGVITSEFYDSAEATAPVSTVDYEVSFAAGPDAHGWCHLILTGRTQAGDGTANEVRRRLHWNGDILISEFELRPAGSNGPYRTWITNTIRRAE